MSTLFYIGFIFTFFLLGVVDKLLSEMENRICMTKKAGKKWMDEYLKKV